jgi:single-stranded DNA-binding protein
MVDMAKVFLNGRATADARLLNIEDEERMSKAVFDIACNIPLPRKAGKEQYKRTIFRRVVVLGAAAKYVSDCQESDGLQGRLIIIEGIMDNDYYTDSETGEKYEREIIRVVNPTGNITIIDRRQ